MPDRGGSPWPDGARFGDMVSSLQQRVALVALVGVLLIPLLASNLRGLTHLLTCSEAVAQPFAITGLDDGAPSITASTTLERDDDGTADGGTAGDEGDGGQDGGELLCDALVVELSASDDGPDRVLLRVAVTNESQLPWRGTPDLTADGEQVQVDSGLSAPLGRVEPGTTEEATLVLRVPPGQTELAGTLLLGP